MDKVLFRWLIGLVLVSTVLGAFISYLWYWTLAKLNGVKREDITSRKTVLTENGVITGIVERVFFTVAIATGMSSITIGMVAWTALKSQTLWAAFMKNKEWDCVSVSILASLGSMIIAIVAGKICSGAIW